MKIAKMMPMNYTVVYVEDGGKYSAYRRHSTGEWRSASDDKKIDSDKSEKLERLFKEEMENNGQHII